MFDFIKKKIKDSINSIQKKLVKEEKADEVKELAAEKIEVAKEETKQAAEIKEEDKKILKEISTTKETSRAEKETPTEDRTEREPKVQKSKSNKKKEEAPEKETERKHKVFRHKISKDDIDSLYESIEEALLENNVAVAVLEALHKDLAENLIGKEVSFLSNKKEIESAIKKSISDIMFEYPVEKLISGIKQKKPFVILIIGVNGAGKTTTLAKLIKFFAKNGFKITVSASDTFRAASIEQLEIHTRKLGVEMIKHNYGADPAAVAFDAIKHAKAENSDIVLIDTAGRSDINKNLIEELKKVKRVSKPDLTIFIGDALTGNDAVNQAQIFDREVGIDASILSKADVDKKGGAVLSISYITKKPIMFLGTGQGYDDLVPFDKEKTADFLLD